MISFSNSSSTSLLDQITKSAKVSSNNTSATNGFKESQDSLARIYQQIQLIKYKNQDSNESKNNNTTTNQKTDIREYSFQDQLDPQSKKALEELDLDYDAMESMACMMLYGTTEPKKEVDELKEQIEDKVNSQVLTPESYLVDMDSVLEKYKPQELGMYSTSDILDTIASSKNISKII